jgi:hypothetical protein
VIKAATDDPTVFVYTTSLSLKQVEVSLIKAETTDSNLIHPVTDGAKRTGAKNGDKMKKCDKPPVEKAEDDDSEMTEEEKAKKAEAESKEETVEEEGKEGEEENPKKEKKAKEKKAEEPPKDEKKGAEKEETKKAADPCTMILEKIESMGKVLDRLVESDKKVHAGIEKAETPADDTEHNITKAEMEQDFKKALDAALAPVNAEIDALKKANTDLVKANTDLAAKLEVWGNETIVKSGIQFTYLEKDHEGKATLSNAGAIHKLIKG